MSKAPVTYVLEVRIANTPTWSPLLDDERKRVTFTGPHGQVRAVKLAKDVAKVAVYDGVNVVRHYTKDGEPWEARVWQWTKQGGVSV